MDVLSELRRMPTDATPVRVIVLTASASRRQVLDALQLGARGVVLKESATEFLVKAMWTVMAGGRWIGREKVSSIERFFMLATNRELFGQKNYGLTPRELEALSAVVAGYSNGEIADCCNIGEDNVKRHLSNLFDKLDVSSRLELALFAVNRASRGNAAAPALVQ